MLLSLDDLVVRTEVNKLVTDLVNLDRVRSLLRSLTCRRRFLRYLEEKRAAKYDHGASSFELVFRPSTEPFSLQISPQSLWTECLKVRLCRRVTSRPRFIASHCLQLHHLDGRDSMTPKTCHSPWKLHPLRDFTAAPISRGTVGRPTTRYRCSLTVFHRKFLCFSNITVWNSSSFIGAPPWLRKIPTKLSTLCRPRSGETSWRKRQSKNTMIDGPCNPWLTFASPFSFDFSPFDSLTYLDLLACYSLRT